MLSSVRQRPVIPDRPPNNSQTPHSTCPYPPGRPSRFLHWWYYRSDGDKSQAGNSRKTTSQTLNIRQEYRPKRCQKMALCSDKAEVCGVLGVYCSAYDSRGVNPSRTAYLVSSATLLIPSLSIMFRRFDSMVLALTWSCMAICLVLLPSDKN